MEDNWQREQFPPSAASLLADVAEDLPGSKGPAYPA
jgi:hypothetical protein